jgi:hypothetical protein
MASTPVIKTKKDAPKRKKSLNKKPKHPTAFHTFLKNNSMILEARECIFCFLADDLDAVLGGRLVPVF